MKHFYLVGGGTGITPLYQIVQYVTEAESPQQRPSVTILFANKTEDDILLQPELKALAEQNPTFKCFFSVDKATRDNWDGFTGFVNEEKIGKTIPEDVENTFFAVCGPPPLCNIVDKMLSTKFNVKPSRFYRF